MGRPVHLLGKFTEHIREDLSEFFQTQLNRRYRSRFEIEKVSLDAIAPAPGSHRWLTFGASTGRCNVALDRNVLLCVLGYRYGTHTSESPPAPDVAAEPAAAEPETATEERLASRLGSQLVEAVAARINALQPDTSTAEGDSKEFTEMASVSLDAAWTLHVGVVEHARNVRGSLWFRLEEGWIAKLLRGLAPARERSRVQKNGATAQPLPARLQLTLVARLLEKEMPLGSLLDLRRGDVLPVTLGTAAVMVGDSLLFTASIAEHKGKLCLTSFEDVE